MNEIAHITTVLTSSINKGLVKAMKNIIAIDGPAGAGKSSISKEVASRLGLVYIDTGAMYRAAALYAIENGIPIKEEDIVPHLDEFEITIETTDKGQKIILNGKDVSGRIREPDVSVGASDIAVIPPVRLKLVELQRKLAKNSRVIMDGRDIGTYVLPDADLKIFLTASLDERAKRRYAELTEKNPEVTLEAVKTDIAYRDKNDSERSFAPLKQAEDAILIDSTGLSFEEVADKISELIVG